MPVPSIPSIHPLRLPVICTSHLHSRFPSSHSFFLCRRRRFSCFFAARLFLQSVRNARVREGFLSIYYSALLLVIVSCRRTSVSQTHRHSHAYIHCT